MLGIEHPREGSRKMSLEGEGYDTLNRCLGEGIPPSCLKASTRNKNLGRGMVGSWSEERATCTDQFFSASKLGIERNEWRKVITYNNTLNRVLS